MIPNSGRKSYKGSPWLTVRVGARASCRTGLLFTPSRDTVQHTNNSSTGFPVLFLRAHLFIEWNIFYRQASLLNGQDFPQRLEVVPNSAVKCPELVFTLSEIILRNIVTAVK